MARLLIVEDDRVTAWALHRAVTRMGHVVVARVASAAEAIAVVQAERPEAVLLDISLAGPQDGLRVGLDIQTFWSTPVIYLSDAHPAQLGLPEFPEALWCYVAKPIDRDQLRTLLAQLFPLPLSGEDPSHPLARARHRWTPPALHEQLRHLRQPAVTREQAEGEPRMIPGANILIVDDERLVALALARRLRQLGHTIAGLATSGTDAIRQALAHHPDLVLMDLLLPGAVDGLEAAQFLRTHLNLPVLVVTGSTDAITLARARYISAREVLAKPVADQALQSALAAALAHHPPVQARGRAGGPEGLGQLLGDITRAYPGSPSADRPVIDSSSSPSGAAMISPGKGTGQTRAFLYAKGSTAGQRQVP